MTVAMDPVVPTRDAPARYANWTPIILGALMATALSTILLAFGATIGLGVASAAPTWRDASAALAILSGLYLIIQAALSFGVVRIDPATHAVTRAGETVPLRPK